MRQLSAPREEPESPIGGQEGERAPGKRRRLSGGHSAPVVEVLALEGCIRAGSAVVLISQPAHIRQVPLHEIGNLRQGPCGGGRLDAVGDEHSHAVVGPTLGSVSPAAK